MSRGLSLKVIHLSNRSGESPALTVKISDLPVGWLLGASVAEKLEYARELHGKYLGMVEFVRKVLET